MKNQVLKANLKLAAVLILLLTTTCGCVKDRLEEDQLPPITQTGKNTFGCVIDGQVLIPKDGGGLNLSGISNRSKSFTAFFPSDNTNNLTITVYNARDKAGGAIYIYIYDLNKVGTYTLRNSEISYGNPAQLAYSHVSIIKPDITDNNNFYYLSYENSGSINISRYDNDIISGTFSLKAVNENDSNDVIEITDGRFDIDHNTINRN